MSGWPPPRCRSSSSARRCGPCCPDAPLLGTGPDLAVLKGVGDPVRLAESFGLAGRGGYQGVGHTRMATESAVTVAHCHPFTPAAGVCVVHNGSFANHATIRRRLRADGVEFDSDNDSEVAARLHRRRGWRPGTTWSRRSRGHARRSTASTPCWSPPRRELAVRPRRHRLQAGRDRRDRRLRRMASEYRALAGLPGIGDARVFEPAPQEVYLWSR